MSSLIWSLLPVAQELCSCETWLCTHHGAQGAHELFKYCVFLNHVGDVGTGSG